GSFAISAVTVHFRADQLPKHFKFPTQIRSVFIAVIGIMIGTQVHPEILSDLYLIALSLVFMTVYVPVAHATNYLIYHHIGGYNPATAYFAGAPGGLMESLLIGEVHGADPRLLTLQQFLRIILVITAVPLVISVWVGAPVGSAAGLAEHLPDMSLPIWQMLPLVAATGFGGAKVARHLNLPASHLIGPLGAATLVNMTGVVSLALPVWLVVMAQVVIGVSLGVRFLNMGAALILRGLGLSALSVGTMLALGMIAALFLRVITGQPFDVLLISFSPGGVTEMSLIALSLAANPAVVTLHHIYRIFITVTLMSLGAKLIPNNPSAR
ncbi:MAG: AbrB family transcriptional regulator, partial [Paracoccaceae bacterium]|nr:AbrB family transcriptional regulator [Paracoccaceae bacterium]